MVTRDVSAVTDADAEEQRAARVAQIHDGVRQSGMVPKNAATFLSRGQENGATEPNSTSHFHVPPTDHQLAPWLVSHIFAIAKDEYA
jgi:hypothetical protein